MMFGFNNFNLTKFRSFVCKSKNFDFKGFYSLDLLFSIFFILIISTMCFSFLTTNINQTNGEIERIEGRIILSEISNLINSLSSNGDNYSVWYKMPDTVAGHSYRVVVCKNYIYFECDSSKGQSLIIPVNLVNTYGNSISKYYLYSGSNYHFKKYLNNNNETSLKIIKVGG